MRKVIVYVPTEHADRIREVIGREGGGRIGNYSNASFSSKGIGRFKPESGARPVIGEMGKLEAVEEERIEFVCKESDEGSIIAAIKAAHPYEEPAIESFLVDLH